MTAKRPLVVASLRASEQWATLGRDGCLENVVDEAVLEGRLRGDRKLGDRGCVVDLGGGIVALVRRDRPSPLRTRMRSWSIVGLSSGAVGESSSAASGDTTAGSLAPLAATEVGGSLSLPASPALSGRHEPWEGVTPDGDD